MCNFYLEGVVKVATLAPDMQGINETKLMTTQVPVDVQERFHRIAKNSGLSVRALGARVYAKFVADYEEGRVRLTKPELTEG